MGLASVYNDFLARSIVLLVKEYSFDRLVKKAQRKSAGVIVAILHVCMDSIFSRLESYHSQTFPKQASVSYSCGSYFLLIATNDGLRRFQNNKGLSYIQMTWVGNHVLKFNDGAED